MANNYTQGAALVPSEYLVSGGAAAAMAIVDSRVTRDECDDDAWLDFTLEVENWNGSLYIGSGESLNEDDLVRFLTAITEAKLLIKSFDLEFASYCDKLRPGDFGGCCVRVLPDGELLWFSTNLADLTDEQFRCLANVREHPSEYTSAPDA